MEFNDAAAAETLGDGIRPNVKFIDDAGRALETVRMLVRTQQGRSHDIEITAAKGGPLNPMTDAELEEKLAELAAYRGFNRDVGAIAEAVWSLDGAEDAGEIMALANMAG
jgi:2-methylcitrate dehydratase PrpD